MLTTLQQKWILHLSNEHKIKIQPYNSNVINIFQKVKRIIRAKIGNSYPVEHHGATYLKISGQGDLDIYLPVSKNKFNSLIEPLSKLFGNPHSNYEFERVRFVTNIDNTNVEIFIINKNTPGWLDSIRFENYLIKHKAALKKYEELKKSFHNLGGQDYYRAKIEFINEILSILETD
jgi:GrpB-like predicted nucleotidyltransferase (UPF0157 family)